MGEWWTLPMVSHQEGGGVAVVSDDVAEGITDLSIPELLREVQAKQHGTIQVGRGFVLLRSRGADDVVSVVHVGMMARIRTLWGVWWSVRKVAQGGLWGVADALY